jgi:hypothetical protein
MRTPAKGCSRGVEYRASSVRKFADSTTNESDERKLHSQESVLRISKRSNSSFRQIVKIIQLVLISSNGVKNVLSINFEYKSKSEGI